MTYRHGRVTDKTVVSLLFCLTAAAYKYYNFLFFALEKYGKQEAHLSNSQPVSEVSGVGQGCGEAHHSDALGGVGGDEVGPGHDDLQHGTSVLTWNTQQVHMLSQKCWFS